MSAQWSSVRHWVYVMHSDPSHGWLAVTIAEVLSLGIADEISSFSYMSESTGLVYLEEDCDAAKLINAKGGIDALDIVEKHTDQSHWIRNLPRFHADTITRNWS